MSYDGSSFYGDLFCDEYDDKNNFMIPETSTGYYVYKIIGGALDKMQELNSKFLRDYDILSSDSRSLDLFWGISYGMPRPTLPISERKLNDDEYRVYLYLRNCRLLTMQDIMICVGKAFDTSVEVIKITNYSHYLQTSDHLNYIPKTTTTSNIAKRDDDDTKHFVTDYADDADTELIESGLSEEAESQIIIEIPFQGWSQEFLEFLQPYLSIKGTIVLKEATG